MGKTAEKGDLTKGPVMRTMLAFAVPMILGNLLQQCYNVADTLIVGQFLGPNALAAVGSSYTLMTFLTSILLGLCIGSGAVFSIRFGRKDEDGLKECIRSDSSMVFILYGDVCSIARIVKTVRDAGKIAVVHLDLIQGLSPKEAALEYIRKATCADGIITTRPALIHRAKELGFFTVLRFFVIDSMA